METDALRDEIERLMVELGEDTTVARPEERVVLERIREMLERSRDQRLAEAQEAWAAYLPYAAKRCDRLARLEEGWEDDLDYFASENTQFWLDLANAQLERGEVSRLNATLEQVLGAAKLMKRDRITQVDLLLQALEIALEISDRKRAVQLYEEAQKIYTRQLSGGDAYTGSVWVRKIKKLGQQLVHAQSQLRRYFHYAEAVTVTVEAGSARDLERVLDYLQQSLGEHIKVTRRAKEEEQEHPARARIKITLE